MEQQKVKLTHKFGRLPIAVCPLTTVPHIYIVHIPTKYKDDLTSFMQEHDEEVWDAIEEEFGSCDGVCYDENENEQECDCEFPTLVDFSGCTYRLADDEDLQGLM